MKEDKPTLYLISGQGADHRLFERLSIPSHHLIVLPVPIPELGWKMADIAEAMLAGIETKERFSLLGVSMGGMIAIEMSKLVQSEHLILVSSAKVRSELPPLYRFFSYVPLNKLISGQIYKYSADIARSIFEPASKPNEKLFREMIADKDPLYMERTIDAIINWQNQEPPAHYVHFHGDQDHTLPLKWIKNAKVISGGSHMMILMKGEELSRRINQVLEPS